MEPTITIDSAGTETPIITQFHTNRPQKIHFDIRRVELPEKTDDVLLAYYKGDGSDISKVYREDLWGFVNTNGEVIDLSKEQIANSFFPFFENGYKSIYTDDGRSGYMNGKGEIRFIV